MDDPGVTISIVNHSNRNVLLECLRGIERECTRSTRSAEIVVLDNASSDGSAEAVRLHHPSVRLIEQTYRAGFGANHNRIAREASGRYLFILNDDAVLEGGCIDVLADRLDGDANVAAAAPRVRSPDGAVQQTAWRFLTPARAFMAALTLGQLGIVQSGGGDGMRFVDRASGCALLIRRDVFDAVGRFDEGYFMYSEDSDLCLRIREMGHEVIYEPAASVTHRSAESSARVPERRIAEQWRSQRRYWRLHHGRIQAAIAGGAMGFSLATRAMISALWGLLPSRLHPGRLANWPVAEFWLAARSACFGPRGPGLRELAQQWNVEHGVHARNESRAQEPNAGLHRPA